MFKLPGRHTAALQTISQEITAKLMRRIVDRFYVVGAKLPTERELASEFSVTRHVVREALKRLEAVGLVRIRQGSGIYVEEMQLVGGPELFEVLLRREDGSISLKFLEDVVEFRGDIFRTAVRLAASRRTPEELAEIKGLVQQRRESMSNAAHVEAVNLRLFRVVAKATHNQIYELLYNTLGQLSVRLGALVDIPLLGFEQTQTFLERVADAFEHADGELADLWVARYLMAIRQSLAKTPLAAPNAAG